MPPHLFSPGASVIFVLPPPRDVISVIEQNVKAPREEGLESAVGRIAEGFSL